MERKLFHYDFHGLDETTVSCIEAMRKFCKIRFPPGTDQLLRRHGKLPSQLHQYLSRLPMEHIPQDAQQDFKILLGSGHFPPSLWKEMGELGFLGAVVPEAYGGAGLQPLQLAYMTAEASRYASGGILSPAAHAALPTLIISKYGTENQKKRYLPGLCSGNLIGSLAMTEPGGGSGFKNMKTKATHHDGYWTLNGRKQWITNAGDGFRHHGICLVFAKTNDKSGYSYFILETGMEGFHWGRDEEKLLMPWSTTSEISFDNVQIPAENLLGGVPHVGLKSQLLPGLADERRILAGVPIGIAIQVFQDTINYVNNPERSLTQHQAVRIRLAEMLEHCQSAESYFHRVCNGDPDTVGSALMINHACESAKQVALIGYELHGGYGSTIECGVLGQLLDSLLLLVGAGARDVRRDGAISYILKSLV